jgi:hypothetical protein
VAGQSEDFVLVPRKPSPGMLEAAWAYIRDEDGLGVWNAMISAYEEESGRVEHREFGDG